MAESTDFLVKEETRGNDELVVGNGTLIKIARNCLLGRVKVVGLYDYMGMNSEVREQYFYCRQILCTFYKAPDSWLNCDMKINPDKL